MKWFNDVLSRRIRLTDERQWHIENTHPEMAGQIDRIEKTLLEPERIVRSITDSDIELFYRYYDITPVTNKYLCVVVKTAISDLFIITAYFTNTAKRGELRWERK
ncbi:MAG: hypothetical protein P9X24_02980 [Candidatus Hatepunaea meridiana]|nr:hypothetical protein [Candidatus Hatepunaea meridiana]